MKKGISIILATILLVSSISINFAQVSEDMLVPEFYGRTFDKSKTQAILGSATGYDNLLNSYYKDVRDMTYLEDLTRLSAMEIVKNKGKKKFRPKDDITGYESLELLVTLTGNQEAVERKVLQGYSASLEQLQGAYNEEYFNEALRLGIITEDEIMNLHDGVSRELFAVWTARAIGLQPVYKEQDGVFSFSDWGEVTPRFRPIIESVLQNDVISATNDGSFKPKSKITRGEVANVLSRATKHIYNRLGIAEAYGLVISIDQTQRIENGKEIGSKIIYLQNIDGQVQAIKVIDNRSKNTRNDFITFKKFMSNSDLITIGDEVEYLIKNGEVIYANVMPSDELMKKLTIVDETKKGMIMYFGTVHNKTKTQQWKDGKNIQTTRARIMNFDGAMFDIVVDEDLYTGIKNDVLVFKDEKLGGIDSLNIGEQIQYLVSPNREVIYIIKKKMNPYKVTGTVRKVHKDKVTGEYRLTVFTYDDEIKEFPVAKWAPITINLRGATLDEFIIGQDVTLDINAGYVVKVSSETFVDNAGYIPLDGKIRMGSVYRIFGDGVLVKLNSGKLYSYKIDSSVPIIKGGVDISYRALKVGDKIKLFFDTIYTDKVSKAEVEGIERLIQHCYKGNLANLNEATGIMTLHDVSYLKNDTFQPLKNYSKEVKISPLMEIYAGDRAVPIERLMRDYKNQQVYVIVENHYGKEEGTKLSIKTNGELVHSNGIAKIDKPISMLELRDKSNIQMTKGTIIVKDGKLVGQEHLKIRDRLVVVSEYAPENERANVIKVVTSRDDIFERIYIGSILNTYSYGFTMKNYASVVNNRFDEAKQNTSPRFMMNTDTVIKDVTDEDNPKLLTPNRFYNGSYGAYDNEKKKGDDGLKYKKYYGMLVKNRENQVIQLNLRYKGLVKGKNIDDHTTKRNTVVDRIDETTENMVFTRGLVDSMDLKRKRVKLTDSSDWTGDLGEWTVNVTDTHFEYDNAYTIFVKDDKYATAEDMEEGNELYIVRLKEKAYVVFIEE